MSTPDDDLAQVHRLALKRIREITMDVAERLYTQSLEPEADLGEIATKIARVARAVRFTIALEARLADAGRRCAEAEKREQTALAAANWRPPLDVQMAIELAQEGERLAERKLEGVSLIQRAIDKTPESERERFEERFFKSQRENDYLAFTHDDTPMAETITQICRELGLAPDWTAFTDIDWKLAARETREALIALPMSERPPNADDVLRQTNGHAPPSPRSTGPPSTWMG